MNLLILSPYYLPEEPPIAFLLNELAQTLGHKGHAVTVLTGYPSWPNGELVPGYKSSEFSKEVIGFVTVARMPFRLTFGRSLLSRALDFLGFRFAVRRHRHRVNRPDLIFAPVPSNENAMAARSLAKFFGCPYVVNVQDIHPDGAIKLGFIKNRLAIGLLRRQERLMYRDASHVVTIGHCFRKSLIDKGLPEGKITVVPNWINTSEITMKSHVNELRKVWAIPDDKFVVLYSGTFGRIHGTDTIVKSAEMLRHRTNIVFLLVGQGYDFERCREFVSEHALENVVIRDFVPRNRLPELQAISSISLVCLRSGFGYTSIPSKILGYMAAGRAVLAMADNDCDTANLIAKANCGRVIAPEDPIALRNAIVELEDSRDLVASWGVNARKFSVENLDVSVLTEQAALVLERQIRVAESSKIGRRTS